MPYHSKHCTGMLHGTREDRVDQEQTGVSRIVLWGWFVFLPTKISWLFSVVTLQMHIWALNSTPPLLPQPPFSRHPRRFTSSNSAPSLTELLQKRSLSLRREGFVRTQEPPGSAPANWSSTITKTCKELGKRKNSPECITCTLWSSVCDINCESVEVRRLPFNLDDDDAKQTDRQMNSSTADKSQLHLVLKAVARATYCRTRRGQINLIGIHCSWTTVTYYNHQSVVIEGHHWQVWSVDRTLLIVYVWLSRCWNW